VRVRPADKPGRVRVSPRAWLFGVNHTGNAFASNLIRWKALPEHNRFSFRLKELLMRPVSALGASTRIWRTSRKKRFKSFRGLFDRMGIHTNSKY
jgi:hypothetical protein